MGRLRGVRHVAAAVAAVLLLGAGCASAGSSETSSRTSDCQAQVRVGGEVYTGYAFTRHEPSARYAEAEVADCDDNGTDARGSVFRGGATQVETWSFAGHDPGDVLAVRFDARSWEVYFSESVPRDVLEETVRELSSAARRPTPASRSR